MTAPIPRWRNRSRPGRKRLTTDRSPLPRRQTVLLNPAPDPAAAGDLLLLGLLYFLFREKADEELLVALGLLLIL